MPLTVKFVSLYHIDIDKTENNIIKRDVNISDAKEYIQSLASNMISNEKMRKYEIKSTSNPIVHNILTLIRQTNPIEALEESAPTLSDNIELDTPLNNIANRLLLAQQEAQNRHAFTQIKKGSLIQAYVISDNNPMYSIALIDHSSFIDESDLKKRSGLPDNSKATFKNVRIHFNQDLSLSSIYVSDSQPKISKYWYDDFLDLKETHDNITNTTYAYRFINSMLSNKLSKKHKQDLIEYNNSLKIYFTKNDNFDFNECLDFIFKGDPYSTNLDVHALKNEIISKKNQRNVFDNVFNIDITDIKKALRHRNYKLNPNVELKLKTSDDTIKENVFATKLENGDTVLAIANVDPEQLKSFNFYNIDID